MQTTIMDYKMIYPYGLDKFVRFAREVWNIDGEGKAKESIALEGIAALQEFIVSSGMATTLRELGAIEEMLPLIAESTDLGGYYKSLTHADILKILKECY